MIAGFYFHSITRPKEDTVISASDPKTKAMLYMVLCAVLWSTAGIFIKWIPWNPLVIAGMRSLISAVLYLFYMRYRKTVFVFDRYSFLSGFFLCGTFIFFVISNKLTTAANAIVLQFTAPIFILILSALIFRQRFRAYDVVTVLATTVGISLFFLDKLAGGYLTGNLLAILAGLFFASMFITTSRASETSRMSGILLGHLMTAVIGIPFIFLYETPVTTASVLGILFLGIFQLGIPYVLYGLAIKHCSPLACSLISAIEPLLNPLWVFLFFHEVPGFFALIGGSIVIGSVVSWCILSNRAVASRSSR